jgi:branched-chain amino acid transport system ATP-binding protein
LVAVCGRSSGDNIDDTAMIALLDVKGLTKNYGKLTALHEVSFTVAHSEILGLIGPNGAGKTTLIGILSGAINPSAGSVYYFERPIIGLKSYRMGELGIVRTFQLVQPFLHLTACECVMLGSLFGAADKRSVGVGAARERAIALLKMVGLNDKADTQAELLNIPERKKLEVARAIAARPKLLLLDEVMAGLSNSEVDEIITLLRNLRGDGVSIIVIEHVMQAIRGLADRVIVLHHGEKIADGSMADVLAQDNVVKNYMGAAH